MTLHQLRYPGEPHHQELELLSALALEEGDVDAAYRLADRRCRIKPLPEEGARLRQQVELALRSDLGEQRGALVLELASDWLNSQFSHFGTASKTISVARQPDGGYNIKIHDWNSQQFTAGVPRIDPYIPAHLLPLFSAVMAPADVDAQAAVSTPEK